jgi:hypothetical protein
MPSYTGFERRSVHSEGNLNNVLFGVVDETLRQIFKDVGVKVIYDFFERNACLKREEIIEKPKVFSAGLERLLSSAAPVIEKQIMRNLHGRFRLEYVDRDEFEFAHSLEDLKCKVHLVEKTDRNQRKKGKKADAAVEASPSFSSSLSSKTAKEVKKFG